MIKRVANRKGRPASNTMNPNRGRTTRRGHFYDTPWWETMMNGPEAKVGIFGRIGRMVKRAYGWVMRVKEVPSKPVTREFFTPRVDTHKEEAALLSPSMGKMRSALVRNRLG